MCNPHKQKASSERPHRHSTIKKELNDTHKIFQPRPPASTPAAAQLTQLRSALVAGRAAVDRGEGLWQRRAAADGVGQLLCHHDCWGVEVAADHGRHDGGVDDAEVGDAAADAGRGVDDGALVLAHAHGAARVVGALGLCADPVVDLLVGLDLGGRGDGVGAEGVKGLLLEDLAGELDGGAQVDQVLWVLEVVWLDARRRARVGRLQLDEAAAERPHRADVGLEGVAAARVELAAERARQEVVLDVRVGQALAAADEAAALQVRAGRLAGAKEDPLQAVPHHVMREAPLVRVEGDRLCAAVLHIEVQMVLQVLPDAGQVGLDGDAPLGQLGRVADAAEQQQLRRIDGSAAQNNLAPRRHHPHVTQSAA
eukprot:m.118851 g.118851  ORF g.118851 m.118851 type:complete len:368 (+) comp16135_c0_seq2:228-1331(+)